MIEEHENHDFTFKKTSTTLSTLRHMTLTGDKTQQL